MLDFERQFRRILIGTLFAETVLQVIGVLLYLLSNDRIYMLIALGLSLVANVALAVYWFARRPREM